MSGAAEGDIISRPGLIWLGENLPSESSLSQLSSTESITHISSGWLHSAVVCASGRVYTLGDTDYHGWMEKLNINVPTLVRDLDSHTITQAACGWNFTFFLTDQGQLFSCGWNVCGQLGLGNTTHNPAPVLVRGLPRVKKVAAGFGHTVVLTESGEVWGCGHNGSGQLGLGHYNETSTFTRVSDLPGPIIDVSCGGHFTALLTASGDLMMAGDNEYNQLGLSGVETPSRFLSLSLPSTIIAAVACGQYHTAALAVDGTVWVWGFNNYGQLGVGTTVKKSLPTRVEGLEGHTISSVFAGGNHTALVTQQGDLFVWGGGRYGELGHGKVNISTPTLLKKCQDLRVEQIEFGLMHSFLNMTQEPRSTPSEVNEQTVRQQTHDGMRDFPTDLERTTMDTLKCPGCFEMMTAPIQQCCIGHSLCDRCYSNQKVETCPTCRGQFIGTRNYSLEYLSDHAELPCSECLTRMPVATLNSHDCVCPQDLRDIR